MTYKLSVIIPARQEFYYDLDLLGHTITNVLENTSEATEIIAVLDGSWSLKPLPTSPRLTVIHHNKSIGQRAATNEGVRLSRAKYVMKLDAHTAVGPRFDEILLADMQPHWTCVPLQYNLLAFEWKCKKCGWIKDQSPKPEKCGKCDSRFLKQVTVWKPRDGKEGRRNTPTESWRFDTTLTFQYWGTYSADKNYCDKHKVLYRPEAQGEIHDTMSLLGACWMIERERYLDLNICDEKMGSWGQQGTEIACKTWLSGGELKVNKKTWFAHFFRVGGIPFPYAGGGQKERAVARCKELWLDNKWEKQVRPLSWLIEKFAPVPDWHLGNPSVAEIKSGLRLYQDSEILRQVKVAGEEFNKRRLGETYSPMDNSTLWANSDCPVKIPTKAAIYYTCNSHDLTLELAARNNLKAATNGHEVGCVSRERTDFGDWNIVVDREKSGTTMHYQILAGLERSSAKYVFLCESDVMYHRSHFDFTPPDDSTIYYNTNVWRIRYSDGHAVRTDDLQQVSGICANRELLLAHYRRRIEWIEANGGKFDVKRMAYEPGTRGDIWGVKVANWQSEFPNVDVTDHGKTLTKPKFSVDEFRNKRYAVGWQETDEPLNGWPQIAGRVQEWLKELANEQ